MPNSIGDLNPQMSVIEEKNFYFRNFLLEAGFNLVDNYFMEAEMK